jgi:hypothetical protein
MVHPDCAFVPFLNRNDRPQENAPIDTLASLESNVMHYIETHLPHLHILARRALAQPRHEVRPLVVGDLVLGDDADNPRNGLPDPSPAQRPRNISFQMLLSTGSLGRSWEA